MHSMRKSYDERAMCVCMYVESWSTFSDRTRFQTISNFFLPYVTFLLLMPFRLYCIEYEEEHVERVSFHGTDET